MKSLPEQTNQIAREVVDAAFQVHRELGPGLLESAYEACLAHELGARGLRVDCQVILPVTYKNLKLETGYRIDLLVEKVIIVELKVVEAIQPIHEAQLITYLRLADISLGFLINFNVKLFKEGIKRLIV